ncbi:MAG: type II toxin-antitoxin system YafQ family toxin [Verrucomicrobia bacterium]|nr:type II toxin-antitoxin system YafQ family toxin [Verrucomicrobiota bacterium]
MRRLQQTKQFFKEVKRAKKRGKDLEKLKSVVSKLARDIELHEKYQDHALIGNWKGSRDCHIEPDWLLIYTKKENVLLLERTGTHSDLFDK